MCSLHGNVFPNNNDNLPQLRDPFPDLKVEACDVVELLARTEEFNSGDVIYFYHSMSNKD